MEQVDKLSRQTWVQILTLPLTNHMVLGTFSKVSKFPESQSFLISRVEVKIFSKLNCDED